MSNLASARCQMHALLATFANELHETGFASGREGIQAFGYSESGVLDQSREGQSAARGQGRDKRQSVGRPFVGCTWSYCVRLGCIRPGWAYHVSDRDSDRGISRHCDR